MKMLMIVVDEAHKEELEAYLGRRGVRRLHRDLPARSAWARAAPGSARAPSRQTSAVIFSLVEAAASTNRRSRPRALRSLSRAAEDGQLGRRFGGLRSGPAVASSAPCRRVTPIAGASSARRWRSRQPARRSNLLVGFDAELGGTMFEIEELVAREILDSRGNPTLEVDCHLAGGASGRAAVPSGASTGKREALELRDGDERYGGKGVQQAVENVDERDRARARRRRRARSGVRRPHADRAGRHAEQEPARRQRDPRRLARRRPRRRPRPPACRSTRYVGGTARHRAAGADDERAQRRRARRQLGRHPGVHARAARRCRAFAEALRAGAEIYHTLKKVLNESGLATGVGDEGGFAPNLASNQEALDLLLAAIERGRLSPGEQVGLAFDAAASELGRERAGRGALRARGRGQERPRRRRADRALRRAGSTVTRWCRSRTAWPRATGTGWQRAHRGARRARPARRRRRLRHQSGDPRAAASSDGVGQRAAGQAQPDRHPHRDARGGRDGQDRRLRQRHLPPLGRDRGHDHRRPRGRHPRRPDQDRRPVPQRPCRQVQPPAAHRGGAGGRGVVSRARAPIRVSARERRRRTPPRRTSPSGSRCCSPRECCCCSSCSASAPCAAGVCSRASMPRRRG